MAEKVTKTITYLASSLNTLNDLELSCERDEAFLGKVIKIEPAAIDKPDGEKAVAITYEKIPLSSPVNLGHLTFKPFTSEAVANRETTILLQAGATPVLPGDNPDKDKSRAKAFIKANAVQFLVFRDKKTP